MKKYHAFAMVLISSLLLAGCTGNLERKPHQASSLLMDTIVTITTYDDSSVQELEKAMDFVKKADTLYNRYDKDSDVAKVNSMAWERPVQVDDLTFGIIKEAVAYGNLTKGAMDITVGPLVDLWNISDSDDKNIPSGAEISDRLKLVNYRQIVLDDKNRTVYLPCKGASLDLGAVAKGFVTRGVAEILRNEGVQSALISLGGNIYALGSKPGGELWQVAVLDPFDQDRVTATFNVRDQSVDTAGDYYRFKEVNGVKFSHIIDPTSGIPAGGVASVTVIADDPMKADALSTASFVLGEEKGMALLEAVQGVAGLMILKNGEVITTANFREVAKNFKLIESDKIHGQN